MKPVMVLLAGPNGAGKSTLYTNRVAPNFPGPFINADLIQRNELQDRSLEASYVAARIATARRSDHLRSGKSFATETVFSHPSKLELVREALSRDFDVVCLHVSVSQVELSIERVKARVSEGGHPVPEDKIRERFARTGPLIREAMMISTRGIVFDNSKLNLPPEHALLFTKGQKRSMTTALPAWVTSLYG